MGWVSDDLAGFAEKTFALCKGGEKLLYLSTFPLLSQVFGKSNILAVYCHKNTADSKCYLKKSGVSWYKSRFTILEVWRLTMARVCKVTGKRPMSGNNVSHANNKTKRRFLPNLQSRRFWVESENRWVRLRVSNAALRTIDKVGIDVVLADLRARGEA